MKHNSPGCATTDCCGGACWTCDDPVALVLAGSTCCVSGTFAFGNFGLITGNPACGAKYTVSPSIIVFRDAAVTVTGGGTDRACCYSVGVVNTFTCVDICSQQPFADTIEDPGTTLRGCHWLVLYGAVVTAYVMNVSGSPTVFVVLTRIYRWYGVKASLIGINCDSALPSIILFYEWIYDDSWQMVVDCDNATDPITHTGRTLVSCLSVTGGGSSDATSYTSADDDGFTWGFNTWATPAAPVFRYDLCEPTASLSF